jgi:AhpD family alkylhydroperoxidase
MSWKKFLDETSVKFEKLAKETPETFRGFGIMGKPAKTSGELDEKVKEFIALGIAIATRCESCIGFHTRSLVRLGASRKEFIEALSVSSYMGGGPSISFSSKALEAFDEFTSE